MAHEGGRDKVEGTGDAGTETAGRASQGQGEAVADCRLHGPAREGSIEGTKGQKRESRPGEIARKWVTDRKLNRIGG